MYCGINSAAALLHTLSMCRSTTRQGHGPAWQALQTPSALCRRDQHAFVYVQDIACQGAACGVQTSMQSVGS